MDFGEIILGWVREHIGVLFMGLAGAVVTLFAVPSNGWKEKISSFIVGIVLASALAPAAANFLTGGKGAAIFGFVLGLGGMTIAKIIIKTVEKKAKLTIEEKSGVKLDDDNS